LSVAPRQGGVAAHHHESKPKACRARGRGPKVIAEAGRGRHPARQQP